MRRQRLDSGWQEPVNELLRRTVAHLVMNLEVHARYLGLRADFRPRSAIGGVREGVGECQECSRSPHGVEFLPVIEHHLARGANRVGKGGNSGAEFGALVV